MMPRSGRRNAKNEKQSHKIYESNSIELFLLLIPLSPIGNIGPSLNYFRLFTKCIFHFLCRLGNNAFRTGEYERALCMYSKAIDHVKDSPLLYNNRSLTYIRFVL